MHLYALLCSLVALGADPDTAGFVGPVDALPDEAPAWEPSGSPLARKRSVPDFDAREEDADGVDEALLLPRVLLVPGYVVTDWLVRRPIGAVMAAMERSRLQYRAAEVLSFSDGRARLLPNVQFTSGLSPALGATLRYEGLVVPEIDAEIGGAVGWHRALFLHAQAERSVSEDPATVLVRLSENRRSDWVFAGVGPQPGDPLVSRYHHRRTQGRLGITSGEAAEHLWGGVTLDLSDNGLDCSRVDRGDDLCGGDGIPGSSDDLFDVIGPGVVPRFDVGYALAELRGQGAWDSRGPGATVGTGLRAEARGGLGQGFAVDGDFEVRLARYGGELSAFVAPFRLPDRTFGARLGADFVDPIGGGALVPFTELARMGGMETMRGFITGRFHGRSVVLGTLDYRYPVWSHADAILFAEAGNAFGPRLEDFSPGLLRGTFGFGLRSRGVPFLPRSLEANVALGTGPLGDPLRVDSVRLNVGTNLGF